MEEDASGRRRSGPHKLAGEASAASSAPARPVLAKHVGKGAGTVPAVEADLKVEPFEFIDSSRLKKRASDEVQRQQQQQQVEEGGKAGQAEEASANDEWKDGAAFEKQVTMQSPTSLENTVRIRVSFSSRDRRGGVRA